MNSRHTAPIIILLLLSMIGCSSDQPTNRIEVPSTTIHIQGSSHGGCGRVYQFSPRDGVTCWAWKCYNAGGMSCVNDNDSNGNSDSELERTGVQ